MTENEFEIYQKTIARRTKIRWLSTLIYLIVALGSTVLLYISGIDMEKYELEYTLLILGGSVMLIILVLFPFFNKITPPKRPDGNLTESTVNFKPDRIFSINIKMRIVLYLVIPFLFITWVLTLVYVVQGNYIEAIIFGVTGTLILLTVILFDTITLIADKDQIIVRLGPLKDVINMKDVETVRPISVRPFRDFMGIGSD